MCSRLLISTSCSIFFFQRAAHLSLNVGDRSMELNLVGWREGSQDFERSAQRTIAIAGEPVLVGALC
jgi:hypothetical protein